MKENTDSAFSLPLTTCYNFSFHLKNILRLLVQDPSDPVGLDKVLIISLTFRELPKPALSILANAYKPVCKVDCVFVWWRNCKTHRWDHCFIPSRANDLPFGTMRVVRQNTFIIFINGYLVLNEEQKNQMRSLFD